MVHCVIIRNASYTNKILNNLWKNFIKYDVWESRPLQILWQHTPFNLNTYNFCLQPLNTTSFTLLEFVRELTTRSLTSFIIKAIACIL